MVTMWSLLGLVVALSLFVRYLTGFGTTRERLANLEAAHKAAIEEAKLRGHIRKKYEEEINNIDTDDPNLFS
jgi:hypothetical protein|tara:strand:- start:952 stop:1167 length:216 start_codon:yes stop_codon:yes gene_type:complete